MEARPSPAAPQADLGGLSAVEALLRLERDGPNELPGVESRSALLRFIDQLVHFFALMLWAAAILAWFAGLPQLTVAIAAVVVFNGLFAFLQERRADHAAERLRSLLPRRVTVRRDGRPVQVEAAQVVVGDLLVLEAGDRIPADAEVVVAHAGLVDRSLLTGESVPVELAVGDVVLAGTFLVEGEAEATVVAAGEHTRLAAIARLTTSTSRPVTPLAKELHHVVRMIAAIAIGVGVAFFGLSMLLGNPASDGLVFAIGVTVALVPEALLPTVTLSLAWGAEQMAKRQVLVRELEAVETLGSTTYICTDKTGTLTLNQMAVVEVWTPQGTARISGAGYEPEGNVTCSSNEAAAALLPLALAAVRCSRGYAMPADGSWVPHGDPMEAAIDVLGRRVGIDTDAERRRVARALRFPFDPRRRRTSTVLGDALFLKGAPDSVFSQCSGPGLGAARAALDELSARGLRVLAVATRGLDPAVPLSVDTAETDLEVCGLIGLQDPPRADVADALEQCRRFGITVAMITGDHPATAAAIADEIGLRTPDGPVFVGDDLPDDEAVLGALLDRPGVVVARVTPEDKLRIARAIRARGHVVAMTGDGVNDGPALHEADIGIAMGRSGTDVAREAADLVLLDDRFASIVAGVEQGRATFLNIRRFLTYHLTDNVAELTPFVVWAMSGGRIPLALGVMQILALDIGTDTLSATALGAEPPGTHVLGRPPVSGRLLNHTVLRRAFAIFGPIIAAGSTAAFLVSFVAAGWRPGESFPAGHVAAAASGAAFMTVVIGQVANAFVCRSTSRTPGQLGWTTNRLLLPAKSLELVFSLVVVFWDRLADTLDHANPPLAGWVVAFATGAAVLGTDALLKRHGRARGASGPVSAARGPASAC